MTQRYDVVIVGGGPVGAGLALDLVGLGRDEHSADVLIRTATTRGPSCATP